MYNLEHLRIFVETAETGSFSACARKLGKVQSAISQAIANLEVDLDVQLFDRTTRKPGLTAEGAHLLSYAQAVLLQAGELSTAAQAIGRQEELDIKLALDNALLMPSLSQILLRFGQHFPATVLDLISVASPDVAVLVKSGRADLGLMFSEVGFNREVNLCFIGHLPFYAVCSPRHPLATLEQINATHLVSHRQLLLRGEVGDFLDQIDPLSAEIWWANSFYAIRELVIQGIGWSYIPCHLAKDAIDRGELHRMPLSFDHKPWSPPVEIILPKNKVMGLALSWLSEELKKLLNDDFTF